jgi:hypothetical protein
MERDQLKQAVIYLQEARVDPVPDPLILRESSIPGIEFGTSESAAKKSDH